MKSSSSLPIRPDFIPNQFYSFFGSDLPGSLFWFGLAGTCDLLGLVVLGGLGLGFSVQLCFHPILSGLKHHLKCWAV